jgi:hypothetical protein
MKLAHKISADAIGPIPSSSLYRAFRLAYCLARLAHVAVLVGVFVSTPSLSY